MNNTSLDEIPMTHSGKVLVIEGGFQMRSNLNNRGIHVGDVLTVIRAGILKGPIVVRVHGMDVALGRRMASRIMMEEI